MTSADTQEFEQNLGGHLDAVFDLNNEAILRQLEIIGEREGGFIDCWVPMHLVDNDEVPVKEDHVISLAEQMGREIDDADGEGTGQITPITLGMIEGESKLKITDGFHRSAALVLREEAKVYSTVKRTDWNGLYDERIYMAKEHRQVRFSRVVQWIREVWEYSGLDDRLTVEQAVLLYRYDTAGKKLGLDPDTVEAAKAWVARKEKQWDIAAMTIHSHLKVAENVDPALVHSTREKKGGHVLEAPTQQIIKAFSTLIPNRFEIQNLVMDIAKARNLHGPEVRGLCTLVKDCENVAAASLVVDQIDWAAWTPIYSKTKTKALRRAHDPRQKGAQVLQRAGHEIQSVIDRIDLIFERGEEVTGEMIDNIRAALSRTDELTASLGTLGLRLSELLGEQGEQANKPAMASRREPRHIKAESEPDEFEEIDIDLEEEELDDYEEDESTYDIEENGLEWDEETIDSPYDDSEDEAEEPTSLSRKLEPTKIISGDPGPTAHSNRLEQEITDFLNGKRPDPPEIKTRADISRAEQLVIKGSFSGHPFLRDDMREEIDRARKSINQRMSDRARR